jgi:hypothetical protein
MNESADTSRFPMSFTGLWDQCKKLDVSIDPVLSQFWERFSVTVAFIFSLNFCDGRKVTVLLDRRMSVSPVWGFLPFLAHLKFTWNLPKPEIRTSSPLARVFLNISNRLSTISSARLRLRNAQSISGNKNRWGPLYRLLNLTFFITLSTISVLVSVIRGPDFAF